MWTSRPRRIGLAARSSWLAADSPLFIKSTDIWRFEDVLPQQFRGVVHQGLHEVRTGEALDGVLSRLPHGTPPDAVQGVRARPHAALPGGERTAVQGKGSRAQSGEPRAAARAGAGVAPPPSRAASDARARTRARAGAAPALRRAPSPPRHRAPGFAGPVEAGPARRGRPVRRLREPRLRVAPSRLQQSVPRRAAVPPVPHGEALGHLVARGRRAGQVPGGVPRRGSPFPALPHPTPLPWGEGAREEMSNVEC